MFEQAFRNIDDILDKPYRWKSWAAPKDKAEKHELSHLYEAKIRNMGNAGRNGGE